MKRIGLLLVLTLSLLPIVAAGEEAGCPAKLENPTAKQLLDKLSADSQADRDWALGYTMGVYGVHTKQQVLPDMEEEKRIAEVVRKSIAGKPEVWERPATEVLKEIFDKELPKESR